jgi:CSLREA domain-containing protein
MQHLIKPIRSWRAAVLPATFFCGLLATFPAPAQGLAWLQADTSLLHYTSSGVPMADLSEGATPLSLITIDFDHDGIPDLVAGFDSAGAGRLKLLRGQGIGAVPAFVPAGWVEIPFPPDLLATLDFDRDGRADLVVASRHHRRLLWLAGAVDGGLEPATELPLPGVPTALATGEFDHREGVTTLAVAVEERGEAAALLFRRPEPMSAGDPHVVVLPAPAHDLLIANLVEGVDHELAVALGDRLAVVRSTDSGAGAAGDLALEEHAVPALALAAGYFNGTAKGPRQLAALDDTGAVRVIDLAVVEDAQPSMFVERGTPVSGSRLIAVRHPATAGEALAVWGRDGGTQLVSMDTALAEPVREAVPLADAVAAVALRLDSDAFTDLAVLTAEGELTTVTQGTTPTFTVNSTGDQNDANPGDGICSITEPPPASPTCTLRAAIDEANATTAPRKIHFAIGDPLLLIPRTITAVVGLPPIINPVTIENTRNYEVIIDGSGLTNGVGMWPWNHNGTVLRNLTIRGFPQWGVILGGGGHFVEGCRILDNAEGGIAITSGTATNTIGGTAAGQRNIIGGNDGNGIQIFSDAVAGNLIQGNWIGLAASGNAANPNAGSGIHSVLPVTIGGAVAGASNVISGNGEHGIFVEGADDVIVEGNRVGTNSAGSEAISNGEHGVSIVAGSLHRIGGGTTSRRNIISGNTNVGIRMLDASGVISGNYVGTNGIGSAGLGNKTGIHLNGDSAVVISGSGSVRSVVSGNLENGILVTTNLPGEIKGLYVGTSADGALVIPNGWTGIILSSHGWVIGSTDTPANGNVVSGNGGHGIVLGGNDLFIGYNQVGIGPDGTPMGNGKVGIMFVETANAAIGGQGPGNTIAFNAESGIEIRGKLANGNIISGNSIFANGGLGIDLGGDGVTPNDPDDADTGPNDLVNFPVLQAVTDATTMVNITYQGKPNASFIIDLYINSECDPSGHGEGESFELSTTVATNANGNGSTTVDLERVVPKGQYFTATATPSTSPLGGTSEFSACAPAAGEPVIFRDRFESL